MISRIIGLALAAGGLFYIYRGYESSQSFGDQFLKFTSGQLGDQTLMLYGGGIAALVVGLLVFFSSKPG